MSAMASATPGQAIMINKEWPIQSTEKHSPDITRNAEPKPEIKSPQPTTEDFQHGVQTAEAVTQLWGKKQLVAAYLL